MDPIPFWELQKAASIFHASNNKGWTPANPTASATMKQFL